MTIDIASASVAEIDIVAVLLAASFTNSWDEPWSRDFLARVLVTPGAFALIARDSAASADMPVGFVVVRASGEECEILTIGVTVGARRRGVGRALLAAVMDQASVLGATSIALEVAEDNDAALGLYRSHGFTEIGRCARYYRRGEARIDALILRGDAT